MKFRIEDSIESLIQEIAGPVEISVKDKIEYTITGISQDNIPKVRAAIKKMIKSQGKLYNEID